VSRLSICWAKVADYSSHCCNYSQAENNPLVQAILKTFPGAKLDAVRRKGEQTSLVAGLVEAGEEPPAGEEYPADDDIPESEY